ncbi:MAG: mercuric reductase [Spirochaeta sp.]
MKTYDVILIGTGQATGSLVPALQQRGLSLAVVEGDRVGGSCVNYGCTPTKTLVASARAAHMARRGADFGVSVPSVDIDFSAVMQRMNRMPCSESFQSWLEETLDFYPGWASFVDEHSVEVNGTVIHGERIIIHTGTRARVPDISGLDSVSWLDNRGLLNLDILPEHLVIIGGSYIGLEFAQIFRRFGSEVTILQRSERLLTREDPEMSDVAMEIMQAEGVTCHTGVHVESVSPEENGVEVRFTRGGTQTTVAGSHLLVGAGRVPNSDRLNLDAAGVETDERGFIRVNDDTSTTVPHIYALGDINGHSHFTHTSVHDGQVFLDRLDGGRKSIGSRIPVHALYTDPPLGRAGMTEAEARKAGKRYRIATRKMSTIARAREKDETTGMVKLIVEKDTDLLLGAAVYGTGGDEIIAMPAVVMQNRLPYTAITDTVLPHPTVSELLPWIFADLADPGG